MQSKAATVEEYLAELPEDRRTAIAAVREEILKNLPAGYEEGMTYGMIGYYIPHSIYPDGYHCDPKQPVPFVNVASQKNHMAVYMFCSYIDPADKEAFLKAYEATGKKLDMGAACVRFKKLADLPLELIGSTIAKIPIERHLETYTRLIPASKKKKP